MVFVDPKDLRYRPFWERWIKSRTNKDEVAMLNNLYNKIVEPCVEFVSLQHKLYTSLNHFVLLIRFNFYKTSFTEQMCMY